MLWRTKVDISGWTAKRVNDDWKTGRFQYLILDPQGNRRRYSGGIATNTSDDSVFWSKSHDIEKVRKEMAKDIRRLARRVGNQTVAVEVGEEVKF